MSIPFKNRHIGPRKDQIQEMLSVLGFNSLEDLIKTIVPDNILSLSTTDIPIEMSEAETIQRLRELAEKNKIYKSYFDENKLPARTCIGVTGLAVGASVEIDLIAKQ